MWKEAFVVCSKTLLQQFDTIPPVVYIELHKRHYVFRLTQPVFVIIIISNTTCIDQAGYHQVLIWYKNLKLKRKM